MAAILCACSSPHRAPADAGTDARPVDAGSIDAEESRLPPSVVSVTPDIGSTAGLDEVLIRGGGLMEASDVLFGESAAPSFEVLGYGRIRAFTPPRPPGTVQVTVRVRHESASGEVSYSDLELPSAFTYHAPVAVTGVEPSSGSARGGEPVTIRGAGFAPGTRIVFGERLAVQPVILDPFTATVISPPGAAGRVHVVAANDVGTGTLKNAFRYIEKPAIRYIAPAVASSAGDTAVRLHGSGLIGAGAAVWIVDGGPPGPSLHHGAIVASAHDGRWLDVRVPELPPGVYGARYHNPDGSASCQGCVTVIDAARSPLGDAITSVSPASSPANLEPLVAVTITGPVAASPQPLVRFDGLAGQFVGRHPGPEDRSATVVVRAPEAGPGGLPRKVDVTVAGGTEVAKVEAAFEWTAAQARVIDVYPYNLDAAGGTAVTVVYGPGASALGKPLAARVGALWSAELEQGPGGDPGERHLELVAPAGSPGPADLEITFEKGTLELAGAALYGGGKPSVAALIPARGSQAGGTRVRMVGTGLDKLVGVGVGGRAVQDFKVVHPGLAYLRTPPGKPGPADVVARFAGVPDTTLGNAFVYFDPLAGNLGTWGESIEHTVNITVTQRYFSQGGPVEQAWVILGADKATPYKGLTDSRGQITFSGPDLRGPLDVHASKPGFTAASIIGFNVENATLLLRNKQPHAGSGSADPPDKKAPPPFLPGRIRGRVVDASKYVQLPAGTCAAHPVVGGHCALCGSDGDCGEGTTCEGLGDPLAGFSLGGPGQATETTGQRYCSSACLSAADCPASFECRAVSLQPGHNSYRCVPRIGRPETRCEISRYDFFVPSTDPGKGWVVDPKTGVFELGSRLGDVAVYCRGGYVRDRDGVFVPLAMGVARNVQVQSGTATEGVEIALDIPLRRTVRLRLVRLPAGAPTVQHTRFAEAALELGGDGWIPIGRARTTLRTDTLSLERQPSTLKGPLKGVNYAFYAGLINEFDELLAPKALAWAEKLKPADSDTFAWWPTGAEGPESRQSWAAPISAVAQAGELAVGVGDGGAISVWSGQGWSQQASPTSEHLHAVWLAEGGGDGWAGGELGVLLRRDPAAGWRSAISPTPRTIVGLAGRATDDVWILDEGHRLWHRGPGPNGGAVGWRGRAGPVGPPVPVTIASGFVVDAERLDCIWQSDQGEVFVGGDNGRWWRAASSAGKLAWTPGPKVTSLRLRAFVGGSSGEVWLLGDRGFVARWDGKQLLPITPVTDQPLFAGRLVGETLHAVGGQGAWVTVQGGKAVSRGVKMAVDLHGIVARTAGIAAAGHAVVPLGPYLELPTVTQPAKSEALVRDLAWSNLPGPGADLNRVLVTIWAGWPQWDIFVRGDLKALKLPNWPEIGGFSPLPSGPLRIQVYRILAPSLDVDHFDYGKLSLRAWVSYAFGWAVTEAGPGPVSPFP